MLLGKESCLPQSLEIRIDSYRSYFDLIKSPMDLSTMQAKLNAGVYSDRFAFESDFNLMIDNAQLYNPPGAYAHNESKALDEIFKKRMSPSSLAAHCYWDP